MFFILNNENTVLAADEACLEAIGVSSVFLLSERFRSGEFVLDEAGRTVHVDGVVHRFEKHTVQTLLGRGYYYQLIEADAHAQEEETVTSPRETIEDLISVTNSPDRKRSESKKTLETPMASRQASSAAKTVFSLLRIKNIS